MNPRSELDGGIRAQQEAEMWEERAAGELEHVREEKRKNNEVHESKRGNRVLTIQYCSIRSD